MRIAIQNTSAALAAILLALGPAAARADGADGADARLDAGRAIYRSYCYQCHGLSGDARTLAGRSLSPPPRDFTRTAPADLPVEAIRRTLADGRPGTAMVSFASVLDDAGAEAVARYIRASFLRADPVATPYHSAENGWPEAARDPAADAYVRGELAPEEPWERLTPAEQRGRRLYEGACVSCHEPLPAAAGPDEPAWAPLAVSYPRPARPPAGAGLEGVSGATPYAAHEVPPVLPGLTPEAARGKALFEANCAFCHAADGTGRNWIGSFLSPPPRDLTAPGLTLRDDPAALAGRIRTGLPGSSMPAWGGVLDEAEIRALVAYIRVAFMDGAGLEPAAAP